MEFEKWPNHSPGKRGERVTAGALWVVHRCSNKVTYELISRQKAMG